MANVAPRPGPTSCYVGSVTRDALVPLDSCGFSDPLLVNPLPRAATSLAHSLNNEAPYRIARPDSRLKRRNVPNAQSRCGPHQTNAASAMSRTESRTENQRLRLAADGRDSFIAVD